MNVKNQFVNKLGGLLGATAIRCWMSTLDFKGAYYDWTVDPSLATAARQRIYIFWHEYMLFPIYLRGHCNVSMLLSRHSDAQMLSHAAYHLGFDCVRGSTNRGGVAAIRELLRKSDKMHLTMTPDGPQGPRRRLAPGPIFLASKLGIPLVAMGFGSNKPWRVRSWDRFAIPRPFSRARVVVGPEIHVPGQLDRSGLEHYRGRVGQVLKRLTAEAEAWAESGTRKEGQRNMTRDPKAVEFHRIDEPSIIHRAPHFDGRTRRSTTVQ